MLRFRSGAVVSKMRLVIEGSRAAAPRADLALLKAIARALHWSDELLSGRAPSIAKVGRIALL
jgi:hypothetical protein